MKKLFKKLITFAIIAAALFIGSTILIGYFIDGTISLNSKHYGTASAITFFGVAAFLLSKLFKIMDGKSKSDKAVDSVKDIKGNKVNQYFNNNCNSFNYLCFCLIKISFFCLCIVKHKL